MNTVYDFCNLATDDSQDVCIYDLSTMEEVFKGTMYEAMLSDYADYEVLSFDLGYTEDVYMCLNIETE